MSLLDRIESITGTLGGVLSGDVRVTLESNLAPAVQVYGGPGDGGAGILQSLGIRGGLVVRDSEGRQLAKFGAPAAFEPLRAALIVGAIIAVVWIVKKALRR